MEYIVFHTFTIVLYMPFQTVVTTEDMVSNMLVKNPLIAVHTVVAAV